MTRQSLVFISNEKVLVSQEINGQIHPDILIYKSRKIQTESDFRTTLVDLRKGLAEGYFEDLLLGECKIPESHEFVVDCPKEVAYNIVDEITSEIVYFINRSNMSIRVNEYVGDYMTVEANQILVFRGSIENSELLV
jgi:hypothetical protein